MRSRRPGRWARGLVSLLIVALLPTPLPRVEYHNVRHHDAPGEVCEYHDHLLRWHPDASAAEDVPILHWHWGWVPPGVDDAGHSGPDLRLHASRPDEARGPADPASTLAIAPAATPLDRLDRWDDGVSAPSPFAVDPFLTADPPPRTPTDRAVDPADRSPQRPLHARLGRWSC